MKENKAFKDFRKALNESEYSEVLTGYGNRSAHKDGPGLHHLQSAGALAGINAMLATIGKGTYLDPNEAFLKMKVRLNVVQLDFAWKPGSWDGGVGSFDIPVVQFGRVDGYDAQTGQIRFDGKANPTGGYTELNLHVDVELTPESLYVVTAKLTPSVPVAEEVEVAEEWKSLKKTKADLNAIRASGKKVSVQHGEGDTLYRVSKAKKAVKEEAEVNEDYQTTARQKEMQRKIEAQDDRADRAYTTKMTSPSYKKAKAAEKRLNKAERKVNALLAKDTKEYNSPRTYGRGGKLVKRGSRAEVKEGMEQIDEYSQSGGSSAKAGRMVRDTPRTRHGYMQGTQKLTTDYSVSGGKGKMKTDGWKKFETDTEGKPVGVTKSRLRRLKKQGVVEGVEQIDEAGQAKLERLGKAYDKARLGSRGVLNPENKKKLGDAYFKMREKVLDKRKKRIEKGTFNKEKEVQARVAHNKKNYGKGVFGHVFGKKTVKEEIEQIDELRSSYTDELLDAIQKAYKKGGLRGVIKGDEQVSDTTVDEVLQDMKPLFGYDMEYAVKKIKKLLKPRDYAKYKTKMEGWGEEVVLDEKLIGKQKRLDVNKNKRLDSQDFALLRAKKKKPVTEAKMKYWVPRLDKLFNNRDVVRSRPKKSILTQKVQNGKKVGSPRPIAKYEGK